MPTEEADKKYLEAIFSHLQNLTGNNDNAEKLLSSIKGKNSLKAWRKMARRFDPQTPEVHGSALRRIILFGERHKAQDYASVQPLLDVFEKMLDTNEEKVGEEAVNEATRKDILMQLLPEGLDQDTRDSVNAARKTPKNISYESLKEIMSERCEVDEVRAAHLGKGGDQVGEVQGDAGSVGTAVGPDVSKGAGRGSGGGGGARAVPGAPTTAKPPIGCSNEWERSDPRTDNGFPAGTCGGCGSPDHFRNDCPHNLNKGYTRASPPSAKAKAKTRAKAKSALKRHAGNVEESEDKAERRSIIYQRPRCRPRGYRRCRQPC